MRQHNGRYEAHIAIRKGIEHAKECLLAGSVNASAANVHHLRRVDHLGGHVHPPRAVGLVL